VDEESYKEMFQAETMELFPPRRDSVSFHVAGDKVEDIRGSHLVLLFCEFDPWSTSANCAETIIAVKPKERMLKIPYVLFFRESGSYKFAGGSLVKVNPGGTVEVLHDIARTVIEGTPQLRNKGQYFTNVFEVR
jgi:hypothetical protein